MALETTTRPPDSAHPGRATPARSRSRRPPWRPLATLAAAAVVMTVVGWLAGAVPLVATGLVVAAIVGLRVAQLTRRHMRAIERDLAGFGAREWSADELAGWPSLTSPYGAVEAEGLPRSTAARAAAPTRRPLLDRWTVTQVIWAGVVGWAYNALSAFAARLVAGSSFAGPRAVALAVVGKLLSILSTTSLRRTVAISALATVTSTGVLATAAGAAEVGRPAATASTGTAQLTSAISASTTSTYTVRPGDTLSAIAARFGTTVSALAALNHLADPTLIDAGQTLTVRGAAPASAPSSASAPAPASAAAGTSVASGYENPLRAVSNLTPERIDQGVDYAGSGPVYALGSGVVLNTMNAGWPGGAFISYRLTAGSAAGDIVYVAEDLVPAVHVGQQVTSSTVVGTLSGASSSMEVGWAAAPGDGEAAALAAGQWSAYDDAHMVATAYGENFSQLMGALGAPEGRTEGPVQGSLPAGWPSW